MNRLELTRCLDTLRKGDTLVIWKLDRLGRSLRDLPEIVERLENSGVQFISLTEDINTKGASGRLIFHIFAVLADNAEPYQRKVEVSNPQWNLMPMSSNARVMAHIGALL